jgi:PAS domain-containing protein
VKTPAPEAALGASILEALPCATLLVDPAYRIRHANRAARAALGRGAGGSLGEALGCTDPEIGGCSPGGRCGGCEFRGAVRTALGGEPARARGFLLRAGGGTEPADLHLLAMASPVESEGVTCAVLVLQDLEPILGDPGVVPVCAGCGAVEDEEGEWLPLHRYLEDRLGLEAGEGLCAACSRRSEPEGLP